MSVIFFDIEELANVGAIMTSSLHGGLSQSADLAAERLAAFSSVNAAAFNVRYPGHAAKEGAQMGHTKQDLYDAIMAAVPRAPDAQRAWSTANLMHYNCVEAEPTVKDIENVLACVLAVGRALSKKVAAYAERAINA
jgi:hypothetical protein